MARFLTITALVCLAPLVLAAQDSQPEESGPKKPNEVGVYQGVVPGAVNPPAVKVPPGGENRQATWPGFQMLSDGGSRIFVQLTSETSVDAEMQPDKMVVTLRNTAVAGPTNAFPLETRYFNTPVKRARLKAKDQDTLLVLDLRKEITPVVSKEGARDGYFFVYVDFPAGNYLSEGSPTGQGAEEAETSPGESKPVSVGISGSAKGSASGKASASAKFGISKKKMKELDEEKPPPVKVNASGKAGGKARTKFKFGSK